MYRIALLNNLDNFFPAEKYAVQPNAENRQEAILVRSKNLIDFSFCKELLAIARAGAGFNNIPVEDCTEKGIVVFNTPGANANAVKELTLAGLFLSSRGIAEGIAFANSIRNSGNDIPAMVEKEKKEYAGVEIFGKTLGVVGLGKIGALVANAASSLGMKVFAYDPFLSAEAALAVSPVVRVVKKMEELAAVCDYISLHLPLSNNTAALIGEAIFKRMKPGMRILNFARGELVDELALASAIDNGRVACYVTDFPNQRVLRMKNVVAIPHLGASTAEAEENCARMSTLQVRGFLERGVIANSVNFPNMEMEPESHYRLVIINNNRPGMVERMTAVISGAGINIAGMANKAKGEYAVTLIDTDSSPSGVLDAIDAIDGVIRVRSIDIQ
jgi:D-3-phosphoglycerate dehydrogenase / 2-oxoglutarate reductase